MKRKCVGCKAFEDFECDLGYSTTVDKDNMGWAINHRPTEECPKPWTDKQWKELRETRTTGGFRDKPLDKEPIPMSVKHQLSYVVTRREHPHLPFRRGKGLKEVFKFHVRCQNKIRFIYNPKTKKIYEVLTDNYKCLPHGDIIGLHDLKEADCYKLDIDVEYGRYASHVDKWYMGIRWLDPSEIYSYGEGWKRIFENLPPLSKQDLDRIEKYVEIEVERFIRFSFEIGHHHALEKEFERLGLDVNDCKCLE